MQVVKYNGDWPRLFQQERAVLEGIFGEAATIEHVGSTAISGLMAKPIIDIEVGLEDMNLWQTYKQDLLDEGYVFMAERTSPLHVFMPKGDEGCRTHHLHITEYGSDEWQRALMFRDTLKGNKKLADEYGILKSNLATQHAGDRAAYTEAKEVFILKILERV